jgi:hypothetical protein
VRTRSGVKTIASIREMHVERRDCGVMVFISYGDGSTPIQCRAWESADVHDMGMPEELWQERRRDVFDVDRHPFSPGNGTGACEACEQNWPCDVDLILGGHVE